MSRKVFESLLRLTSRCILDVIPTNINTPKITKLTSKSITIINISEEKTMVMSNNNIFKRIRYALDIKDIDMMEIFKLGGTEVKKEDVVDMLTKIKKGHQHEVENADVIEDEYVLTRDMMMLEPFLNGFITLKREKQGPKSGEIAPVQSNESANNLLLKKMKIAPSLTSEDVLDILDSVRVKNTLIFKNNMKKD